MGFQLLLETIQILLQSLDLLPHPAVIRGLFEWDFATKGLSTMQFISVTDAERRARREQYDLSDFSRKNKLTRASDAQLWLSKLNNSSASCRARNWGGILLSLKPVLTFSTGSMSDLNAFEFPWLKIDRSMYTQFTKLLTRGGGGVIRAVNSRRERMSPCLLRTTTKYH
ncbi:hypothetical protein JG687_00017292 [Phytophthora cactorum]|uniref:Uncharacterized protein n=1 Tax=Phytophthora cactorum TaxID=29920 RepID=A0A8T1TRY3_9STRA|nr:hypothetical protein JG687_00017292 [Phytophthora cactorum]